MTLPIVGFVFIGFVRCVRNRRRRRLYTGAVWDTRTFRDDRPAVSNKDRSVGPLRLLVRTMECVQDRIVQSVGVTELIGEVEKIPCSLGDCFESGVHLRTGSRDGTAGQSASSTKSSNTR